LEKYQSRTAVELGGFSVAAAVHIQSGIHTRVAFATVFLFVVEIFNGECDAMVIRRHDLKVKRPLNKG